MSAEFSDMPEWDPRPPTPEEAATLANAAQCLRDAATLIEDTAAGTDKHPWTAPLIRSAMVSWVSLMDPHLAGPLAEWLRDAANEAEEIGADRFAVAFAQSILGELADDE